MRIMTLTRGIVRGMLATALSAALFVGCGPQKNNFVGTWSGATGRAEIDKATVTFFDLRGSAQGTWPVTIVDDHDARVDSPLGSGSLELTDSGALLAKAGGVTTSYQRVSN
jgi:hypothetical protein